jgi:tRNA (guanine37-N1)-methyltransferase
MRFDILTVLPGLLESPFAHSILQRAQKKGIAEIVVHNLRDYATNKQKSVDDYPYGGGSGMVMSIAPFAACIEALKAERDYDEVIFMTPDGPTLNQTMANELSGLGNIIILCGHYKGIDQRIREIYVTREISIGDYVLSGGELPAAVLVDAVVRLIPGVLNDETSALSDSFQGELLDAPIYTRPADWNGHKVPDILLSGHEARINEWRHEQALLRTQKRRPDLLSD